MTGAKHSRHRHRETKPLLRDFQISRFDFVADAISSRCDGGEIRRSGSNEWIEDCVTGEREELN